MERLTHRQLIWELFRILEVVCLKNDVMPGIVVSGGKVKPRDIVHARREFVALTQAAIGQKWRGKTMHYVKLDDGEVFGDGYRPLSTTELAEFLGMKNHTTIVYGNRVRRWMGVVEAERKGYDTPDGADAPPGDNQGATNESI